MHNSSRKGSQQERECLEESTIAAKAPPIIHYVVHQHASGQAAKQPHATRGHHACNTKQIKSDSDMAVRAEGTLSLTI